MGYLSRLFFAIVLCVSVYDTYAQPANDSCVNAIDITADLNSGSCSTYTTAAATDDLEPGCMGNYCSGGPNNNPNENVWFSFTAPFDGDLRVIINGYTWGSPNYDPYVAIFTSCLPSAELGCNEPDGDGTDDDSIKTVTFTNLDTNTTYYIMVDGPCDLEGTFCIQFDYIDPTHCFNSILDYDETSIDCGGADCFACHCFNSTQDFDETGIDCGGADCQVCMDCTDNEDCGSATVLTFTGDPLLACVTDCNTGATTENWIFSGNCPNSSAETVYYTFTTTEPMIDIVITSFDISDPQIVLMEGGCGGWYQCVVGSGGQANIDAFFTGGGNTYTLMVTTQSGQTGVFNLCITNYSDPSACNIGDTLTAAPEPDTSDGNLGGFYAPGTTVQFCYDISLYKQINCNYLHGIVPSWGDCWDDSSFVEITPPASADGKGNWGWYHADTGIAVIYNQTGDTVNQQGGWFYTNDCNPCPTHNGDPNLAWGDGCKAGPCFCDDVDGHGYTWRVCFELTTDSNCINNSDCSVSIKTWTDGQTGPYADIACESDPATLPAIPSPTESCPSCNIFQITETMVLCTSDSTGSVTVSMDTTGAPPYTYAWSTSPVQSDTTATGLVAGTYSIVVTDSVGCIDSGTATITEPTALLVAMTSSIMVLCFGDSTGSATVSTSGGVTPYTFLWDDTSTQTDSVATGLMTGSYTVLVTDSNGCIDSATISITQPAAVLAVNITGLTNILCNSNTTGDATVTVTGGTTVYNYLWNDIGTQTTSLAAGLGAGNYVVVVTDANGCNDSDNVTLTEPSALLLSISDTNDANCGFSDGNATVSVSGAITPYTYLWSDPASQTDTIATGLAAASYTVIVTDGNGCQDSISVNINNAGGGTASITDTTHILCNGDSIGSATITPTGGGSPFTFSWDDPNTQTDSIATGLKAGTYTGTVIDNAGCVALASVTITEPSALSFSVTSITNVSCNGSSDGSIDIAVSGATAPYTYLWNDSGTQTNAIATGLGAGNYTLTVTDNNSCIDSVITTVTEPAVLSVSVTGSTQVGCNGDSTGTATVSSSGGTTPYTYLWNDANSQTDSASIGLPAGTYMAYVTDMNGCMDSVSTTITEPALLSLTMTADSTSCNGYSDGQVYVTLAGGTSNFNYVWSSGDSTINTASTSDTSSGLTAGMYSVVVNDANGCSAIDSVSIEQPLDVSLTTNVIANVSCKGDSDGTANVIINYGLSPFNYMWSSGDTTATSDTFNVVSGLSAGTFYIQIADANGCINADSVIITEPTALNVATIVDANASCNGDADGSAIVNTGGGGTSPYDYVWSNGFTTLGSASNINNAIGLAAGIYYVTVTDANSCVSIDSVTISEPAALVLSTSSVAANCGVNDGIAIVSVTGGTTPYTYLWNDPFTQTTDSATGLGAGTYNVVVYDSASCLIGIAVIVGNLGAATLVTDSVTSPTCNGSTDGEIYVSVSGGALPYTYLWSNSDTIEDIANLTAGSYSLTVTDGANCQSILDTTISDPILLTVVAAPTDITCNGATDGVATAVPSGGTSPYTYLWSDPGSQTNATATGLAVGTYVVLITDMNGCIISDSASISEPSALSLTMNSIGAGCGATDGQASVAVSGGTSPYIYSWNDPANQTNSTAVNLGGATYAVNVSDANGCSDVASVTVIDSPLIAIAGPDISICVGESVQLNASGGTGYTWTPVTGLSASNISDPIATPQVSTMYTVVVTSGSCTPDTATAIIAVNSNPTVTVTSDPGATGGGVQLTGQGAISYNWTPSTGLSCTSCPDPIATPIVTTTYTVVGTDANGCNDTSSIEVDIGYYIYIPEIFSTASLEPRNTVAYVQGKGVREVITFVIYDRWGEKVFENKNFQANDPALGWNGMFRGKLMNPAVFVYYVEAVYLNGETYTEQGDITLMK